MTGRAYYNECDPQKAAWLRLAHSADARRNDAGEHGSGLPLLAARPEQRSDALRLGDTLGAGLELGKRVGGVQSEALESSTRQTIERADGEPGGLADAEHDGRRADLARRESQGREADGRDCEDVCMVEGDDGYAFREGADCDFSKIARDLHDATAHALNGYWRDADWLLCTDGRWRPVEPGTFPLVASTSADLGRDGDLGLQVAQGTAEARLMRLRGYGDGLNAQVAAEFIRAVREA